MRGGPRDSDASFASTRPSTASFGHGGGPGRPSNITDLSFKQSAVRRINSYLSSHNSPYSLSLKPLPSNRDISETLKFILSRLEFNSNKAEDDLLPLLKLLNCPHKLNRSALKAPGTPHAFPGVLAVLHWLVQIADYKDHLSPSLESEENLSLYTDLDPVTAHALSSYVSFMCGDDDAVDAMTSEFNSKMETHKNAWKEKVDSLEKEIAELEGKLERLRSGPSPLEALGVEKQDLEKDKQKFEEFIVMLTDGAETSKKSLDDKEKELAAALEEKERICKESEELKKKVETQKIDSWVAERMRREMQALERDITEAESARTEWEEKSWRLEEEINHQLKELEALSIESNQLLRRLKLASDLQYVLNAKGSTVVEVLGIDSKSTIKPAIKSLGDETKKNSMANSEELLVLQQQAVELNKKIEVKKKHISELRHRIDETEAQLSSLKSEIENYELKCVAEAENMCKVVEAETQNLNMEEREAKQTLTAAKLKLQETERQVEDEIQMCGYELAALIDDVSKHKEYMEGKLDEMTKEISGTAECVSESHKRSLSLQFNMLFSHPRDQQLPLDITTFREAKKAKKQVRSLNPSMLSSDEMDSD